MDTSAFTANTGFNSAPIPCCKDAAPAYGAPRMTTGGAATTQIRLDASRQRKRIDKSRLHRQLTLSRQQLDTLRDSLGRIARQAFYDPREPWGPVRPPKKTRRGKRGGKRQHGSAAGSPRPRVRRDASVYSEVVASALAADAKDQSDATGVAKTPSRSNANTVEWVHPRELQMGKRRRLRNSPKTQDQDNRSLRTKLCCAEARARKAEAKLKEHAEKEAWRDAKKHPDTDIWQIENPAHRGRDPLDIIDELQWDLIAVKSDLKMAEADKKATEGRLKQAAGTLEAHGQATLALRTELQNLRAENTDLGRQLQIEARHAIEEVAAPEPDLRADSNESASPASTRLLAPMAAARVNASKRPQLQVQASAGEAAPMGLPILTKAEEAVGFVLAAPDQAAVPEAKIELYEKQGPVEFAPAAVDREAELVSKYEMLEWELECTRDAIKAVGVWGTVDAEFQEGRFFW